MLLSELLRTLDYKEIVNRSGLDPEQTDVISLSCDSRKVFSGYMFVCLSGTQTDGHDYAWGAYNRMCRIFVTEHAVISAPGIVVTVGLRSRQADEHRPRKNLSRVAGERDNVGLLGVKP